MEHASEHDQDYYQYDLFQVERQNVSCYSAIVKPHKSHDRLTMQITEEKQTVSKSFEKSYSNNFWSIRILSQFSGRNVH